MKDKEILRKNAEKILDFSLSSLKAHCKEEGDRVFNGILSLINHPREKNIILEVFKELITNLPDTDISKEALNQACCSAIMSRGYWTTP